MANQAFALSPISARASLPSEEDYEAIREAFMETARGRWFLDEYARRNRNADTRMVLDAVARIEETIAAQKQPPPPVVLDRLPAALTAIRGAVEKAQEAAATAFDEVHLAENIAPIRKGARIIKEISWRWREIGADGRICDLIDSQVAAIEASCAHLDETDPRAALRDAFEIIRTEVEAFRDIDARGPAPAAEATVPHVAPLKPARLRADAPPPLASAIHDIAEARAVAEAPALATEESDVIEAAISEPEMPFESATEAVAAELSQEEADAQDEAVLDMVAMEMAAPDPDEEHDLPIAADGEPTHVTTPPVVEPLTAAVQAAAREPEPARGRELPPLEAPAPAPQPAFSASPSVAPDSEPSLGSTLIARGILQTPNTPANDPLAPIRRMSQAEKIAFFS
jgi:hypothetical protein